MTLDLQTIWIVAGIVLLIGEMLSASFFLIFLALGCFGAALAFALGGTWVMQVVVCAAVSVVGALVLRKPIQMRLLKNVSVNADIGKEIQIDQAIAPQSEIRITYQGTSWNARNMDAAEIRQNDRVTIVGIDGTTLLIRKNHS